MAQTCGPRPSEMNSLAVLLRTIEQLPLKLPTGLSRTSVNTTITDLERLGMGVHTTGYYSHWAPCKRYRFCSESGLSWVSILGQTESQLRLTIYAGEEKCAEETNWPLLQLLQGEWRLFSYFTPLRTPPTATVWRDFKSPAPLARPEDAFQPLPGFGRACPWFKSFRRVINARYR